jgi:transcription termination/antitermination protein NusA
MENLNLVETFSEFKEFKNIDRSTMMRILEEVFRHLLIKKHGTSDNFDIVVNIDKGDLEIWRTREIVEDGNVEDENLQIGYSEAIKIEPDFEVGEEVYEQVKLSDFQRREIIAVRQHLNAKILEYEKDNIYKKYIDKVGEILTGEVYQVWRKEILVLDEEGIELVLPKSGQIPADTYKKGDTIRAVVASVEMKNNSPVIYLSRTAPEFLERLFEQEVPEIYDGLITIKKIVREPGERAKVAVESYDERIDPVGACVGMKGSRIHGIVRELRQENIDVVNFTNNTQLYISRALSPAKITNIKLLDDEMRAEVYLKSDQVSLAIGKGGHNIRLAAKLTGYEIDVYRDSAPDNEDVDLQEFDDEIEPWIIEEFKKIGFDTAKSILDVPVAELVARTDLEEETINEVIRILKEEFE